MTPEEALAALAHEAENRFGISPSAVRARVAVRTTQNSALHAVVARTHLERRTWADQPGVMLDDERMGLPAPAPEPFETLSIFVDSPPMSQRCERCLGRGECCGACGGFHEVRCARCKGTGKRADRGADGYSSMITCEACNGAGAIPCRCEPELARACNRCGAAGTLMAPRSVHIERWVDRAEAVAGATRLEAALLDALPLIHTASAADLSARAVVEMVADPYRGGVDPAFAELADSIDAAIPRAAPAKRVLSRRIDLHRAQLVEADCFYLDQRTTVVWVNGKLEEVPMWLAGLE
jgi:hypothetical protein